MSIPTKCMTPGAVFTTHIQPSSVEVAVALPMSLDLNEAEAVHLESTLHNALELALAPLLHTAAALRGDA